MAARGARVVAFDASPRMLKLAAARGDGDGRIEYRLVDATSEPEVRALGLGAFEAAVAAMVLMDIPALEPLARGLAHVLQAGAPFVAAVSHPCFRTTGTRLVMAEDDRDGRPAVAHAVQVRRYAHLAPTRGVSLSGQPETQYYFDRPLAALLGPFFDAGFALDGLEEPTFPEPAEGSAPALWDAYREIPPLLAVRLRLCRPGAGHEPEAGR
jgi:SAM-dependent methyltransferase